MTIIKRPEDIWPVDHEYRDGYLESVRIGRQMSNDLSAVVVGIARTATPHIENTLELVSELNGEFRDFGAYVYENDSSDNTAGVLDDFSQKNNWLRVEHGVLGGDDLRGFHPERTIRLAKCRNKCHDYVRALESKPTYTIVLDLDPHYGFSVDGVFSSIYWLGRNSEAGGMASYSLFSPAPENPNERRMAHYDAWAARPTCWWRDRRNEIGFVWFSTFLPPVGAPPMQMNSAFGGLCVYRTDAFLGAGISPYEGGDCEHVSLHKKMASAGWKFYLNPGCRYVAQW